MAIGLSPVSRLEFNGVSKKETLFMRHYHPVKENGKQDSLHVWFGDYVGTFGGIR